MAKEAQSKRATPHRDLTWCSTLSLYIPRFSSFPSLPRRYATFTELRSHNSYFQRSWKLQFSCILSSPSKTAAITWKNFCQEFTFKLVWFVASPALLNVLLRKLDQSQWIEYHFQVQLSSISSTRKRKSSKLFRIWQIRMFHFTAFAQ